ncbi:MAG: PPC domain-containing protein, partial [Burkholderiales bacterium]|nr:PPC domain-containing protein [Burkholderiales bacterium]
MSERMTSVWSAIKSSGYATFVALYLVACGGGGNDAASTPTPAPPAPAPAAFTVSGTIQAAQGTAIDSDTNEPTVPFASNDTPQLAQSLPNPVNLGGFASQAGTGVQGDRFATAGDQIDAYRVTLAAGQTILLSISDHIAADPTANDLDLELYTVNDTTTAVADASGTGPAESITVPAPSGEYFVVVRAARGKSNYFLTIGQSASTSLTASLSSQHDFVPGEVIVRFKESSLPSNTVDSLQVRARSIGLSAKAGGPQREMLLSVGDESQQQHAFTTLGLPRQDENQSGWGGAAMSVDKRLKHDAIQVV